MVDMIDMSVDDGKGHSVDDRRANMLNIFCWPSVVRDFGSSLGGSSESNRRPEIITRRHEPSTLLLVNAFHNSLRSMTPNTTTRMTHSTASSRWQSL